MAEFKMVEAKLHHCGQLVRKLRAAQSGALATVGARSHAELRACFAESSFKRSWLIDGELAGMMGVTGSHLSSTGLIWLALASMATRHGRRTALVARETLAEVMETRHDVYTIMLKGDPASMRWIEFLRFHEVATQPDWLPDGAVLMRHGKGHP